MSSAIIKKIEQEAINLEGMIQRKIPQSEDGAKKQLRRTDRKVSRLAKEIRSKFKIAMQTGIKFPALDYKNTINHYKKARKAYKLYYNI